MGGRGPGRAGGRPAPCSPRAPPLPQPQPSRQTPLPNTHSSTRAAPSRPPLSPRRGGAGRARGTARAGLSWAPLPPRPGPDAALAALRRGQHAEPAGARRRPGPLLHGDGAAAAPPRTHRLQGHGAGESAPGRAPASAPVLVFSLPFARGAAGRRRAPRLLGSDLPVIRSLKPPLCAERNQRLGCRRGAWRALRGSGLSRRGHPCRGHGWEEGEARARRLLPSPPSAASCQLAASHDVEIAPSAFCSSLSISFGFSPVCCRA